MTTQTSQPHTEKKTDLKSSVISRIEKEKVTPKSKWVCFCVDNAVWLLWIITVIVGAVVFSETIYIGMHSGIEFYEMTHGSLAMFVLDSLPYIWLFAFVLMVGSAYFNMRHTKRGYKYPMWQIIVSSVVFTVVGGFALHTAGVGHALDRMMGNNMPTYTTVEGRQAYLWAHPEDGRITGMFTEVASGTARVRFHDVVDREWIVATHELPPKDIALLHSGKQVRLLGEAEINGAQYFFYSCSVMPWMKDGGQTIKDIRTTKKDLNERMQVYMQENEPIREREAQPSLRCREILSKIMPKK